MPKLDKGHEICDKCKLPYIAKLGGKSCRCDIVIEHKGEEKKTAERLKYRQRARAAERKLAERFPVCRKDCPAYKAWEECGVRITDLEAENKVLREAAKPFSNYACDDWKTCDCRNCILKRALKQVGGE